MKERKYLMSTETSGHSFEIIVRSSPDEIWQAIVDGEITEKYYFHTRAQSDWTVGSVIRYYEQGGDLSSEGNILEIEPGSHVKMTYKPVWLGDSTPSIVIWDVQPLKPSLTRVKLTHAEVDDAIFAQMSSGWVYILSNLKSVLETGQPLPELFG
jgi:uncharacterized protein YndB with AHSA1/START domain